MSIRASLSFVKFVLVLCNGEQRQSQDLVPLQNGVLRSFVKLNSGSCSPTYAVPDQGVSD